MNVYRQGDVVFKEVKSIKIPKDAKEHKKFTVQLGEATGHHHTLYPKNKKGELRVFEINGQRFIEVGTEYFLRHQEHDEHLIVPGLYEISIEEEYCPFEKKMKTVVD